jgi:membrane dipeptidase
MRAMNIRLIGILLLVSAPVLAQSEAALEARVAKVLRESPVIDGHNDLPWELRERTLGDLAKLNLRKDQSNLSKTLHTDISRLRRGGVGAQVWSVWVPTTPSGADDFLTAVEQIDLVHRMVSHYSDTFELALSSSDIARIQKSGSIASLIGMEGGHSIGNSLAALRSAYRLGARSMTLTHSLSTAWADSATDTPKFDGLAPFGVEVVKEMNRLGMLVDLSHVSEQTMLDALNESAAPVVFTHSSAQGIDSHPRNVPDNVLQRLRENGGIIMVTFVGEFISDASRLHDARRIGEEARVKRLNRGNDAAAVAAMNEWDKANPMPQPALAEVADHIDHIRKVAGIDAIGLGGDFDGTDLLPKGLEDVSGYPRLLVELARRGYSDGDLKKITGQNFLRVFRQVEQVAARLQKERGASVMQFVK